LEAGQAFVDLKKGDVYELQLYNRDDAAAAGACITVDGLDVFHFSEPEFRVSDGSPKFKRYVVQAGKYSPTGEPQPGRAAVKGWFAKVAPPDNYYEFRLTNYGSGAASQAGLAAEGKTGVIHVRFARQMVLARTYAYTRGVPNESLETELGERKSVDVTEIKDMDFEEPHDFVAIRYSR
jgi:hypothetical protein